MYAVDAKLEGFSFFMKLHSQPLGRIVMDDSDDFEK